MEYHPKFKVARGRGLVGIPTFVKEDGTVTFKTEGSVWLLRLPYIRQAQHATLMGAGDNVYPRASGVLKTM